MTTQVNGFGSRLNRRNFLRSTAVAAGGLSGAVLIGCGGDDDGGGDGGGSAGTSTAAAGTSTSTAGGGGGGEPARGGKVSWAWQGSSHLDIHTDSISGAGSIVSSAYNRLLRYADDSQIPEPDLAAEWEQPDEQTIVFHLEEGVQFHDKDPVNGRVMTAEDVVYSLERARSDDPAFVHGGDLASVDKIEAIDDTTVQITTKTPNAVLLTTLAGIQFIVLAPEAIEKYGDLKSPEASIGTGAFMVERFSPDAGATLVRHPNYWREGLPYLDEIEQLDIDDAWSQFLAGKIDQAAIAAEQVQGHESFESFLESEGIDAYTYLSASVASAQAHFMNSKAPVFQDQRVRWALNLLADRTPQLTYGWPVGGYPSIALGDGQSAFHLERSVYDTMPGFRQDGREQDIKDGLALLEQAGYTVDNPLVWEIMAWSVPHRTIGIDEIQLAAEMYENVSGGVLKPTVKGLEWGAWKQAEQGYEFEMISSVYSMGADPHDALQKMYHTEGGRNFAQFSDPVFDDMLATEQGTFDIEERQNLVRDMLLYVNDESRLANIWIGTGPSASASALAVQGRPTLFDYGKMDRVYREA